MDFIDALWNPAPQQNGFNPHHVFDPANNNIIINNNNNTLYNDNVPTNGYNPQDMAGQKDKRGVSSVSRLASTSSDGYSSATSCQSPNKKSSSASITSSDESSFLPAPSSNGNGAMINPEKVSSCRLTKRGSSQMIENNGSEYDEDNHMIMTEEVYKFSRSDSGICTGDDEGCSLKDYDKINRRDSLYVTSTKRDSFDSASSINKTPNTKGGGSTVNNNWDNLSSLTTSGNDAGAIINNSPTNFHPSPQSMGECVQREVTIDDGQFEDTPETLASIQAQFNDIATQVLNENTENDSTLSHLINIDTVVGNHNLGSGCSTIMDMLTIPNGSLSPNNNVKGSDHVIKVGTDARINIANVKSQPETEVQAPFKVNSSLVEEDLLLYDDDMNISMNGSATDIYNLKSQCRSMSNINLNNCGTSSSRLPSSSPINNDNFLTPSQLMQTASLLPDVEQGPSRPSSAMAPITASNKSLADYLALFQEINGGTLPPSEYGMRNGGGSNSSVNSMLLQQPTFDANCYGNGIFGGDSDQNLVKKYDPLFSTCSIGSRNDSYDNLTQNANMEMMRSFSVSNMDSGEPIAHHSNSVSNNVNNSHHFTPVASTLINNTSYQLSHNGRHPNATTSNFNLNSSSHMYNQQPIPQLLNDILSAGNGKILSTSGSNSSLSSLSSIASSPSLSFSSKVVEKIKMPNGFSNSRASDSRHSLPHLNHHPNPINEHGQYQSQNYYYEPRNDQAAIVAQRQVDGSGIMTTGGKQSVPPSPQKSPYQPYMAASSPLGPRTYPTRLGNNGSIIKSLLQPDNKDLHQQRQQVDSSGKMGSDVTSTTDLPNHHNSPSPLQQRYNINHNHNVSNLNGHHTYHPYILPPTLKRYSQPILPHYNVLPVPPHLQKMGLTPANTLHHMPPTAGHQPNHGHLPRGEYEIFSNNSTNSNNNNSNLNGHYRRASDSVVDTTNPNQHYSLNCDYDPRRHALPSESPSYHSNGSVLHSDHYHLNSHHNKYMASMGAIGNYTARSRDQRRAEALNIPFSIDEIIYSPIDEFTDILRKHNLTDAQISLIRDIRRRGKNKVAAQNCRKRKIDGIMTLEQEVDYFKSLKVELVHERASVEEDIHVYRHKYDELYSRILGSLRDENGAPYPSNEYVLQFSADGNLFLIPRNQTSPASTMSMPLMKLYDEAYGSQHVLNYKKIHINQAGAQ